MKKTVIIFSLALCAAFLGSCNKDHDKTSNTENASPTNGPAEDQSYTWGENKDSVKASEATQDNTSAAEKKDLGTDSNTKKQTTTSAQEGNTLNKNNERTSNRRKDSVTSVSGEQGSGSGVGDGGSINAAHDAQQKKIK